MKLEKLLVSSTGICAFNVTETRGSPQKSSARVEETNAQVTKQMTRQMIGQMTVVPRRVRNSNGCIGASLIPDIHSAMRRSAFEGTSLTQDECFLGKH